MPKKIFTRKLIELTPHTLAKIKAARLLVIGGSAGSFLPIQMLLSALPQDFFLPVIIILHRGKQYKSSLGTLLQKNNKLIVKEAEEKEVLSPGAVYLAPADYHLLVEPDHSLSLDTSEPVWYCRPSIDVTFESAADVYPGSLIGMLFSGANTDGAEGLLHIVSRGGLALVQDPSDAEFPAMPSSAMEKKACHLLFQAAEIPSLISQIHTLNKNVNP